MISAAHGVERAENGFQDAIVYLSVPPCFLVAHYLTILGVLADKCNFRDGRYTARQLSSVLAAWFIRLKAVPPLPWSSVGTAQWTSLYHIAPIVEKNVETIRHIHHDVQ